MTRLVWTSLARQDLLDVFRRIAAGNASAAERYFDLIEAKAATLAGMPRLGVRRPDISPSARILVAAPHLVLYETEPDTDSGAVDSMAVVRVVDGRRDLADLFDDAAR